jgi:hypothetical protein
MDEVQDRFMKELQKYKEMVAIYDDHAWLDFKEPDLIEDAIKISIKRKKKLIYDLANLVVTPIEYDWDHSDERKTSR